MIFQPLVEAWQLVAFGAAWLALCVWGFGRSRRRSILVMARRLLLGGALVAALAGPSVPAETVEVTSNVEIFIVVDRTGSMAAQDWQDAQSRIAGVRRDLEALVEATASSRYSIITWDSTARQELPLTTDSSAVISFAELLHQEVSEFSAGSSLNRPLWEVEDALANARESRPENFRYVVIFSDGESTDESDLTVSQDWGKLAELVDGGAVFGYGSAQGGNMPIYQAGVGVTDKYMTEDDSETLAVSRMDEASLNELGSLLKIPVMINPSVDQVTGLGKEIMQNASKSSDGRELQAEYRYVVWPLGVAVSLILMWELASFTVHAVRLRRQNAL